jgi:hypothetical protein
MSGWRDWLATDEVRKAFALGERPYAHQLVWIMRPEWPEPQLVVPYELPATFNVEGLLWKPCEDQALAAALLWWEAQPILEKEAFNPEPPLAQLRVLFRQQINRAALRLFPFQPLLQKSLALFVKRFDRIHQG